MFILSLNDMRSGKIEHLTTVCQADTEKELLDLIEREKVHQYWEEFDPGRGTDPNAFDYIPPKKWSKCFRKGGPLEWFNPPYVNRMRDHIWQPPMPVHISKL